MSYTEQDAAMDEFYDQISEELYPDHKEQAIEEFIKERMLSFYFKNPKIIQPAMDCYHHANELLQVSPRCALIMHTAAIELFLKSVLLKPVLYGMIHNEKIAGSIVDVTTGQAGFSRYKKLLNSLCQNAADINLTEIVGMEGKSILNEAEEVQQIRNKVVHQGYKVSIEEMEKAKNIASLILMEVVEPVLNNMSLKISGFDGGIGIVKA